MDAPGARRRPGSPKQDAEGWKAIPLTSRKFYHVNYDFVAADVFLQRRSALFINSFEIRFSHLIEILTGLGDLLNSLRIVCIPLMLGFLVALIMVPFILAIIAWESVVRM
jgi:hypothetical protein